MLSRFNLHAITTYDGDTGDRSRHRPLFDFICRTWPNIPENWLPDDGSNLTVNDIPHMLKRARYSLVKGGVCDNFSNVGNPIPVDQLVTDLDLPHIVVSDILITKMSDRLAMKLFKFDHLMKLYTLRRFGTLRYMFPFFLIAAALFSGHVSRRDIIILLRISLSYFIDLMKISNSTPVKNRLAQRRSGPNSKIRMFDDIFLEEIITSLYSIIAILYNAREDVDLMRIGTQCLERTFGTVRMRSRNENTWEKAITQLQEIQFMRFFDHERLKIRRRLKCDRITSAPNFEQSVWPDDFDPANFARLALYHFGMHQVNYSRCDDSSWWCGIFGLEKIRNGMPLRASVLSLRTVTVPGSGCVAIVNRFTQDVDSLTRIPFSKEEDEILMRNLAGRGQQIPWQAISIAVPNRKRKELQQRIDLLREMYPGLSQSQ
jgi:hypothetical protein